jgi:hypothetical protein
MVLGSGCYTSRALSVPLSLEAASDLRRSLDGRNVEVEHIVDARKRLENGRLDYDPKRISGVVRLDPPGQALLLRLDDGRGANIPLAQTRLITDDQTLKWMGIGTLAGLGGGLATSLALYATKNEDECAACSVFAALAAPIIGTAIGLFVGGLVGSHKSAQWRVTTAVQPGE